MNTHFLNFFLGATYSIIILVLKWWAIKFQDKVSNIGRFLLLNAMFRTLAIVITFVVIGFIVTWKDAFIFIAGFLVFNFLLNKVINSLQNVNNNTKL